MKEQIFSLEISNVTADEASIYAKELRDSLLDASSDVKADLKRVDDNTQEFGSTIVLILGTPAVFVVAQAIRDWIRLRSKVKLKIKKSNGDVLEGENLTGKDAKEIAELLQNQR